MTQKCISFENMKKTFPVENMLLGSCKEWLSINQEQIGVLWVGIGARPPWGHGHYCECSLVFFACGCSKERSCFDIPLNYN